MESRNSVWTKLCVTVGRTTTKVNAHFVPRFFICLHAVSTQSTGMQGALAGSLACSTSRFSLSGYLRHGYKNMWRSNRCKVEQHNSNFTPAFSVTCIGDIFLHLLTCHLSTCYLKAVLL